MTLATRASSLVTCCILAWSSPATAGPLPPNWPIPPSEAERRLAQEHFVITEVKGAGAGVTGASRLRVRFDDGLVLKVKWKESDSDFDGWNNSPRREIAVYEIQKWFLDENDFIVPTTIVRCLPVADYAPIQKRSAGTIEGTKCVLGTLSLWIEDSYPPDRMVDPGPIARDPRFAADFADFNLLTYLVNHRDGRKGNFLISNDRNDPQIFAIDNGISFEAFPWNFLVPNWHKIRTPYLRKESVERLRRVDDERIAQLGTVAEFELDAEGVYRPVRPTKPFDDDDGFRREGRRMQIGLTDDQIERVDERLEKLLKKVDSGKVAVR